MGSQTLEILRQGVWASLTGGWFYDPHQGVFCNVVHLYVWLYLLCSPFVAYLYFPATVLTWTVYCVLTTLTIFGVKMTNMALHRLYDRAQTMSESNLKNPFFKITKDGDEPDEDNGIEMQVMSNDVPSRNSVEQAIYEASEENSIMSIENITGIIDLKVDVHRKNSSESIEFMFYQQDQQSMITTGSNSVSKSLRSAAAADAAAASTSGTATDPNAKYLIVYPEHENEIPHSASLMSASTNHIMSRPAPHLQRKSNKEFIQRHQRRRLERQHSMDAAATADVSQVTKTLSLQQTEPNAAVFPSYCNDTFLHPHQTQTNVGLPKSSSASKVNSTTTNITLTTTTTSTQPSLLTSSAPSTTQNAHQHQRQASLNATTTPTTPNTTTIAAAASVATSAGAPTTMSSPHTAYMLTHVNSNPISKTSRLQRHRSSETHDERLKQQSRGLFLPIHHENHHVSSGAGSSGALAGIHGGDELELGLGGSTGVGANSIDVGRHGHGLLSLVFGSSSDVYLEDDSFTKSDLGIEQLDKRNNTAAAGPKSRSAIVLQQQKQHPNLHYYQHQQPFRHQHHHATNIRKDSNSTMSALQLPVAAAPTNSKQTTNMKRRRHSNATTLYKSGTGGGSGGGSGGGGGISLTPALSSASQQPTVRRIKSAALEIGCPHPSVSNLTPHPNSVEAISGQQQIKNPQSALLPPPSKSLVRNQHLNLCPSYFGSSVNSLNFGASASNSTTALIDPVYPIVEQADEKASLDLDESEQLNDSNVDLVINDMDDDENGEKNTQAETADLEGGVDQEDVAEKDHNNQESCQEFAACPSDVYQMLADDVFKDFDLNLEDNHNDGRRPNSEEPAHEKHHFSNDDSESDSEEIMNEQGVEAASNSAQALRERLHSTDSETDNNGSRSPLLSGSKSRDRAISIAVADKTLMMEIAAVQQQKPVHNSMLPQHLYEVRPHHHPKGEGDSGCPSSDCEQVSASSKDMLLSGMDAPCTSPTTVTQGKYSNKEEKNAKRMEADESKTYNAASTSAAATAAKSLGAIPKVVKYREVDDMRNQKETTPITNGANSSSAVQQLHKRRVANSNNSSNAQDTSNNANNNASSTSKTTSRTSSSTSSRSFSADSFSADIHKMLWLMSGGAVDDTGRPIAVTAHEDGPSSTNAQGTVVPSSMSIAHFQFYQDALNALHSHPSNSVDGLSVSDRMYLREKLRRSSKQISEPGNSSIGEFSHAHDLPAAILSASASHGRSTINDPAIGTVVSSSTLGGGGTRSTSNAAPLTIQGLINVIHDGRHPTTQNRIGDAGSGGIGGPNTSATILNIDSHNIENYCDYWRPALLSTETPMAPKSFYKYCFKLLGYEREFKISMDRLELLALFDRDLHWIHILLSVLLAGMVSYLGATILQLGFYKDLFAFLFCAVIAASQYSLVKSVQPDAASPIHGFNKTVAYSRAIYFCFCGGLLLLLQDLKLSYEQQPREELVFFSISYSPLELTTILLHVMYVLLLCFPLIFSLGLFPQINTFMMYLLEQIDMHVFGGNAAGSLLGSFLCVIRSILGVLILYGPLFAALAEGRGTQYIVFSIFCAMLIPLGYHLSRSASDFSHLWALIKNSIVSTYRDDEDEMSAATLSAECQSQKVATSTPKRVSKEEVSVHSSDDHIEMTCLEKLPTNENEDQANPEEKSCKSKPSSLASSSQTLAKNVSSGKKAVTASNSFTSVDEEAVCAAANGTVELSTGNNVTENAPAKQASTNIKSSPNEEDKVSSSSTTNPGDISTLTAGGATTGNAADNETESPDPLPKKLQHTVNMRLKNDFVVTTLLAVIVFGLHCSTVFTVLQPDLNVVLYAMAGALGLLLHYIIPQMRKHMPWLCFARPLLRPKEFRQFEVADAAKVMWFERVYIYLSMVERNVLFPLLVISALTADAQIIANKFGIAWGTLIVATCALKFIRNAYSDPTNQYLIVMFTVLFFRVDFMVASETFLIDYFFVSLAFRKCCDFLLKLQFIVTYIAPWQITWGSAFHAFAQPFSVPHSAMLFLQAGVSALLSTPLNPFLGSAIFLTSYVRPIKFWERDYNTRRIDHSNTRLSSQLERDLGADDNNLNSIFYEHLTRSLQHSLCGDLLMGRWGNVNQGDCFVLASDYLNCLVHIIELGNGLCTFQMRGLEFRGTYCQQREVEAITEDVEDNDGCCCCDPGHLPRLLSANAMFSTRWLAWQVVAAQYVLEGYSISDNLASATLQVFEYRKVLITYYIKSIIYYVIKNPKLDKWLASGPIQDALQHTLSRQFVDLDPIFNYNLDEDFDFRALGITRTSFCFVYLGWIQYCCDNRKEQQTQPPNFPSNTTSAADETAASTAKNNPTNLTNTQVQSQSQTQLRARPQKSATVSGTGANASASEHTMATSQSYANISRQTSESAPGLALGNASISTQIPLHGSLDNSSATVGGYTRNSARAPQKPPKTYERYYKHDSPTTESATTQPKSSVPRTTPTIPKNSPIVSLCLALGLLARRSLATASHSSLTGVEFFLHGLHALFKGDFRITSPRDEWVFADMELLHAVVAPAVKMALKLQQDHISNPDEFLDPVALYTAIATYSTDLVISHEADPVWRSAVLRGAPNLLALRHVMEDGSDEYRIIRLTKRFLSFRVIKLNRECVRGLWAGQQQELIYLRNRNPERGSIQNAKQALRNIINSSCDQPIGYPIYVSPLTTSYADTNEQLCQVIGGAITPETIKANVIDWWQRLCERCRQGCSSGSALDQAGNLGGGIMVGGTGCSGNIGVEAGEMAPVYISAPLYNTLTVGNSFGLRSANVAGLSSSLSGQYGSQSLAGVTTTRSGLPVMNKPTSTTLLAGLLNREREQERETVRDPRIQRKGQTSMSLSGSRNDRERRATLPITSSCLGVMNGASSSNIEGSMEPTFQLVEEASGVTSTNNTTKNNSCDIQLNSSPRYAKFSCSTGSLGIGNIITTPGEYPRKSKGPICLTAAAASAQGAAENVDNMRKTPIELFKKVIIVDGSEIYDCLDLGRRIDVVWPSEKMRANGGRLSWKDWSPRVGMVGYVVHYWLPNHADQRFRSHVNRTLYLIEIGEHYVPVGEFGVREYNQILDSRENLACSSSRSSVQREFDEHLERERERNNGLTPILGSSLESPTTMAASSSFGDSYVRALRAPIMGPSTTLGLGTVSKIAAVSSSSSDDEELSNLERRMNMHRREIINMMKLMSEKKKEIKAEKRDDDVGNTTPVELVKTKELENESVAETQESSFMKKVESNNEDNDNLVTSTVEKSIEKEENTLTSELTTQPEQEQETENNAEKVVEQPDETPTDEMQPNENQTNSTEETSDV